MTVRIRYPIWQRRSRASRWRRSLRTLLALLLTAASDSLAGFPGEDGKIAYALGGDISVMNPDGSGNRILKSFPGGARLRNPTWSPSGRQLAYLGSVPSQPGRVFIDVTDADGQNTFLAAELSTTLLDTIGPTWSPDGREIAYAIHDGVHIVNVATKQDRNVTGAPPANVRWEQPAWSPDGARIALRIFQGRTGPPYNFRQDIGVVPAAGGAVVNLTRNRNADGSEGDAGCLNGSPDWSPDSTRIVFHTGGCLRPRFFPHLSALLAPKNELVILDVAREALVPLKVDVFDGLVDHLDPKWSPSGRYVVFFYRGAIGPVLYQSLAVVNADGSGLRSTGIDGRRPDWQPAVPEFALAATLAVSSGEVLVGERFTVTMTATNTGAEPLDAVGPAGPLVIEGGSDSVRVLRELTPASAGRLGPGGRATFSAELEAVDGGEVVIRARVRGTSSLGTPVSADARCGLSEVRAARAVGPVCRIDGGAEVAVKACRIDMTDISRPLEVFRIDPGGDSTPAPDSGYPQGGT